MATVDEILTRQAYAAGDGAWTKDNNYPSYTLYVEPEYVPVTNKRIADFNDQISVRGEQNAQFVGFQMPRYDDGLDLTAAHLYIHYQTVYGGSDSVPCNVSWSDNYVRMCWQVPAQATQEPDRVQMMIYATGTNSMGERVTWKTLPASYTIHDGLDIGGGIPEPDPSWYEQFVAQMEGKVSTAQGYANDAQASKTAAAGSAAESAQSAAESAQALEDNRAYVESQKETFVGYNKRETDLKYANALIGTASGMGRVTVGDAWEAPVTDLEVSGRSEQMVTTGAQLLDCSKLNKSAGGAVVNYGDGGYSISGTGALTAFFTASYTLDIKNVLKPGNLILKSQPTMPKLYIRIWDGSNVLVEMQGNSTKQITQDMIDNENVRVECFFHGNAGSTITPGTYHPMLYQSGDGTWEPYTGGKPSPSPEYPQPIISTGTVTTGAQLFDASKLVLNNAEAEISESGRIIKAIGKSSVSSTLSYKFDIKQIAGKTVYLQGDQVSKGDGVIQMQLMIKAADGKYRYATSNPVTAKDIVVSAAIATDDTGVELLLYCNKKSDDDNVAIYENVRVGIAKSAWEPYTGGKPSPSPDYPQPLDVTVAGANLLNTDMLTRQIVNAATGMAYPSTTYIASDYIPNIPGQQYRLSTTDNQYLDQIVAYDINKNAIINGGAHPTPDGLFKVSVNAAYMRIRFYNNGDDFPVAILLNAKPMLNAGPTALPYQPYQSRTVTIPLTEPLRGIGDVRDRIMCRDGVWGIERQFVSLSFNGSENWIASNTGYANKNRFWFGGYENVIRHETNSDVGIKILCDKLPGESSGDTYRCIDGISSNMVGRIMVYLDDFSSGDVPAFKTYLSTHPISAIFELATPTWEPLPSAATQSALNALTTYTGTTHVTITAGGPEPDVGLGYVQDTRAVVADIMAQIDAIRNGGTT